MLDRQRGKIIFECDVCGGVFEPDTSDFAEAIAALRNENWKTKKVGDDWCHSCPNCGDPGERAPLAKSGRKL